LHWLPWSITLSCCYTQGRSVGSINIALSFRNFSTVSIKRVELKLVGILWWTVTPRRWTEYSDTNQENTLWQLPDVLPLVDGLKLSKRSPSSISIPVAHEEKQLFVEMQQDLQPSQSTIAVPIQILPMSTHARSSYKGTLIKVSHLFGVTFYTDTLSIPFQVRSSSAVQK